MREVRAIPREAHHEEASGLGQVRKVTYQQTHCVCVCVGGIQAARGCGAAEMIGGPHVGGKMRGWPGGGGGWWPLPESRQMVPQMVAFT